MREITILLLLSIVFNGTGCANANLSLERRAANFAFVFRYRACGPNDLDVLDTANGTLVHTPIAETASVTVPLRLTDVELDTIYEKIVSISFFGYPSNFVIPDEYRRGMHSPTSAYQLNVTNGSMTNKVTWTDDIIADPAYTEAVHLRELMDLIQEIIRSHPEYQLLPKPKARCA